MRLLTEAELSYWNAGLFPCCGSRLYLKGPRGGPMRNVECPQCETVLNVFDPESGQRTLYGMGQMIREPKGYAPPHRHIKDPKPGFLESLKTWISAIVYTTYQRLRRNQ